MKSSSSGAAIRDQGTAVRKKNKNWRFHESSGLQQELRSLQWEFRQWLGTDVAQVNTAAARIYKNFKRLHFWVATRKFSTVAPKYDNLRLLSVWNRRSKLIKRGNFGGLAEFFKEQEKRAIKRKDLENSFGNQVGFSELEDWRNSFTAF